MLDDFQKLKAQFEDDFGVITLNILEECFGNDVGIITLNILEDFEKLKAHFEDDFGVTKPDPSPPPPPIHTYSDTQQNKTAKKREDIFYVHWLV